MLPSLIEFSNVSIHAPRFREAMPDFADLDVVVVAVSIHAPRFREAMHGKFFRYAQFARFQSTPPVSGRRCRRWATRSAAAYCFNPRPPFPGGDALVVASVRTRSRSFNPRPPFPGGDAKPKRTGSPSG